MAVDIAWVKEILADAEHTSLLTDWETTFCDDMRERVKQYGESTYISVRQLESLQRIEDKLYG